MHFVCYFICRIKTYDRHTDDLSWGQTVKEKERKREGGGLRERGRGWKCRRRGEGKRGRESVLPQKASSHPSLGEVPFHDWDLGFVSKHLSAAAKVKCTMACVWTDVLVVIWAWLGEEAKVQYEVRGKSLEVAGKSRMLHLKRKAKQK